MWGSVSFLFRKYKLLLFLCTLSAIHVATRAFTHRTYHFKPQYSEYTPGSYSQHLSWWVPSYFRQWRGTFLANSKKYDPTGLVSGIFLGSSSEIHQENYKLFRNAGLLHVLAASGYNCWIVAMLFYFGASFLLHLLVRTGRHSTWALRIKFGIYPISFLLGGSLFFLWSDQSPPIVRAFLLITTKFLFWFFNFSAPFSRIFIVHYAVSLLFSPTLWFSASFQLTHACIAGMLIMSTLQKKFFPRSFRNHFIARYFFETLGANLGAAPVTLIFFKEISFMSVLTNCMATPFVSFIAMPLSLVAMIFFNPTLQPFHTSSLADALIQLNSWCTQIFLVLLSGLLDFLPSLRYRAF